MRYQHPDNYDLMMRKISINNQVIAAMKNSRAQTADGNATNKVKFDSKTNSMETAPYKTSFNSRIQSNQLVKPSSTAKMKVFHD